MTILAGDPARFAIESNIHLAYERLSFRGLGYFVIWLNGTMYGVKAQDATLLACSLDTVRDRMARRGSHVFPLIEHANAALIASAVEGAIFDEHRQDETYFGLTAEQFRSDFSRSNVGWAPDGDEAFDDGSHVLHFDLGDTVRLVALTLYGGPASVEDIYLPAQEFYATLDFWQRAFLRNWDESPRLVEAGEGKVLPS